MTASRGRPLLVTFSGMDGAGKSTQIDALRGFLEARGLRTQRLAFWDDVVVLARYREGFVHKVFHSERGIGAPDKPVNRRDKNVRGWHVDLARHFLYLLDAFNLRPVLRRAEGCDVIIMDRYIDDELANLPMGNPFTRVFIHFAAALAPKPDVAFVLDADPEAARARKPEYPLEFLKTCRDSYRRLAAMLGMTMIAPCPIAEASRAIEEAMVQAWERKRGAGLKKNLTARDAEGRKAIADSELPLAG